MVSVKVEKVDEGLKCEVGIEGKGRNVMYESVAMIDALYQNLREVDEAFARDFLRVVGDFPNFVAELDKAHLN